MRDMLRNKFSASNQELDMSRVKQFCLAPILAAALSLPAYAQQPIIYPAKGQPPEQQQKDQGECYAWAKQTTGVDPAAVAQSGASQPAPSGPQGERVGGAARGAVGGAAIGAIAGDAGKGAAIGAVAGTMAGGARQRRKADAQQAQAQANQQQSQQAITTYNRAFGACMEGRGYVFK
jgi:YmgG-like glycine-zipper protein